MFYSINGNLIENFVESEEANTECSEMKSQLASLFDKYNKAKLEKDQAELNIENLKKQIIEAENARDITINNINKIVEEYNNLLMNIHISKCD